MTKPRVIKVLLCGAALSGNMGGPALYISMVESLKNLAATRSIDIEVTILSKYPNADRIPCQELQWKLISFPTSVQLLYAPIALLYWSMRALHLPRNWLARGPLRSYVEHDILVDLSGISFTDDRTLSGLVINSLWLFPAVATGIPWIKASQAMGPFQKWTVNWASRFFLSRADALVARGHESANYVRALLPQQEVHELPDVAYNLPASSSAEVEIRLAELGLASDAPFCVVGPSTVVDQMITRTLDQAAYPQLMAAVADELVRLSGHHVLLIPHARASEASPLDDLAVCERTWARCQRQDVVHVLRDATAAPLLKGIIARAEVAVGSRFHFMVAAVSSGVPALAVSWSHKYAEMMEMVGQERFVMPHHDLTQETLLGKVRTLWHERSAVREQISERLPAVKAQAKQNAEIVLDILGKRQSE